MIDHSYCSMAMGGSCACSCGSYFENIEVEESTELGARSRPRVSECQRRRDRKGTRRIIACYAVSYSMGWFRLSVFLAYDTSF